MDRYGLYCLQIIYIYIYIYIYNMETWKWWYTGNGSPNIPLSLDIAADLIFQRWNLWILQAEGRTANILPVPAPAKAWSSIITCALDANKEGRNKRYNEVPMFNHTLNLCLLQSLNSMSKVESPSPTALTIDTETERPAASLLQHDCLTRLCKLNFHGSILNHGRK